MPYVELGSGSTYYEVHGHGEPLVLVHGGAFGFGAGLLAAQITDLAAAGFTVYTPERRGHGHTADREGPLSYDEMAEETIAFIDTVVKSPVHLVGWSDGMVVAVMTTLRRPDLVDRLVAMGAFFNSEGHAPSYWEDLMTDSRSGPWPELVESQGIISPDGAEHVTAFWGKMIDLWVGGHEIELAELTAIQSPTLLVQGDDDIVTVEHSAAASRALPNGRLVVLPGTHLLPMESPQLLNPVIVAFLRGEVPG